MSSNTFKIPRFTEPVNAQKLCDEYVKKLEAGYINTTRELIGTLIRATGKRHEIHLGFDCRFIPDGKGGNCKINTTFKARIVRRAYNEDSDSMKRITHEEEEDEPQPKKAAKKEDRVDLSLPEFDLE